MGAEIRDWRAVQAEVLRRINSRTWKPGDAIPSEAELAAEFGCSRTTVNRALRTLAEAGLLDRRRKAGTRIALNPVRKATLSIPVIRSEIEAKGLVYGYSLLTRRLGRPPSAVRAQLQVPQEEDMLYLACLHMANGRPYVYENRWINPMAVPQALEADFQNRSPNEWLVANIPFEGGDIAFSATNAGTEEAEILSCPAGSGLFVIDRTTWAQGRMITTVRLLFAPGYRMHTFL